MATADENSELLRVLAHPLRRILLREVEKHPAGISPSELAQQLGESINDCAYHCRVLRDSGAIELVRQAHVRGALKNIYRFSLTDPWAIETLRRDEKPE
jgi:DNA-binding transcriptional ArsR family regulator